VIATVVVAVTEVVDADATSAVWTATATDRTDAITCGIQAVLVRQTLRPDMELGHWVTGSMGHLGHLSRPGHQRL